MFSRAEELIAHHSGLASASEPARQSIRDTLAALYCAFRLDRRIGSRLTWSISWRLDTNCRTQLFWTAGF